MRVVVTGYMVRLAVAGNALAYAQYMLGLERLGHEVVYLEESGWYDSCYDLNADRFGNDPTSGIKAAESIFRRIGIAAPIWYIDSDTRQCWNCTETELINALRQSDLLLNIGGVCYLPELDLCERRALIDMDPMFTQIGRFAAMVADQYHVRFTYGTNIGRDGCRIPVDDRPWNPIVPPIVADLWDTDGHRPMSTHSCRFTTIANWPGYGNKDHEGDSYGQKDEEFRKLIDLPGHTSAALEIAASRMNDEDRRRFVQAGWRIIDGGKVSGDLPTYQAYIQRSHGEFSVAKHGYVLSRSGWVSDRTACYLASGRPAVVQNASPAPWIPTGCGLVLFGDLPSAVDALDRVITDYKQHAAQAREIAYDIFDYRVVLPDMIHRAMTDDSQSIRHGDRRQPATLRTQQ